MVELVLMTHDVLKLVTFSVTIQYTLPEGCLDHISGSGAQIPTQACKCTHTHKCIHKDTTAASAHEWRQNPKIRWRSCNKMRIMQN